MRRQLAVFRAWGLPVIWDARAEPEPQVITVQSVEVTDLPQPRLAITDGRDR